jgi:hypothetical protein
LVVVLSAGAGATEEPAPGATKSPPGPTATELVEDLRILSIVNALEPTRDQAARLAAVAQMAKERLAQIDAQAKTTLAKQRDRLLAARESVLHGGTTPRDTEDLLANAASPRGCGRARRRPSSPS